MPRKHLIPLRRAVQTAFCLFCLYVGWQFYHFYQWAIGASPAYVPRPAAVEAFLPIGALVSLKRLYLTHQYDPIHPAGLTIFLAALSIGLLLRKGFCGWICPVGFTSNLAEQIGRRFKIELTPPAWIDIPLLGVKYLLLAFFVWAILWRMPLPTIEAFLRSEYNVIVDAKMLYFFLSPSRLAGGILIGLLLSSFFLRNPWCRYLCPYGALLGLLALVSPFQVKRSPSACISCQKCERVCPAAISVSHKKNVQSPECIGCLECLAVCPPAECLEIQFFQKRTNPLLMPALIVTLFLGFWMAAKMTNHWQSQLPIEILKQYYGKARIISH